MRSQRILAALLTLALLTIVPSAPVQGDGAFDSLISVTDSRGEVTNLTEPAVHVASFGAFATNTLVDIGMVHKAVIFDAGSEFNKSEIPEMRGVSADSFVTVSSANKDMVVQRMMHLVDEDGTRAATSSSDMAIPTSHLSGTPWRASASTWSPSIPIHMTA